jgi:hypothetical protein
MQSQTRAGFAVPFLLVLLLNGCATPQQTEQQADVTRTIAAATHGIQYYLVSTNANDRQLTLQIAALEGAPISSATLQGSLSQASIRARITALILINAYITKLTALADSDQPAADLESSKTLNPTIASLPQSFAALPATDPTASRYVAPVTTVLSWVGQLTTDADRKQATDAALQSAAPAADEILDLLTADLKIIQTQRSTAADSVTRRELAYYNAHLHSLSLADRQALLAGVDFSSETQSRAQSALGLSLLDQLRQAHQALVTFVRSAHTDADEAQLGRAMTDFEAYVVPLVAAAHAT